MLTRHKQSAITSIISDVFLVFASIPDINNAPLSFVCRFAAKGRTIPFLRSPPQNAQKRGRPFDSRASLYSCAHFICHMKSIFNIADAQPAVKYSFHFCASHLNSLYKICPMFQIHYFLFPPLAFSRWACYHTIVLCAE